MSNHSISSPPHLCYKLTSHFTLSIHTISLITFSHFLNSSMADFCFLSDTDESAVEEVLAEAMDACVLKQIAAINCSSFSHSLLPSHLESRFQRLKTFPSNSKPETRQNPNRDFPDFEGKFPSGQVDFPQIRAKSGDLKVKEGKFRSGQVDFPQIRAKSGDQKVKERKFRSGQVDFPRIRAKSGDRKVKERKFRSGYVSSGSDSLISPSGHVDFPQIKAKSGDQKVKEGKFRSGCVSSGSDSSISSSGQLDFPKLKVKSGDRKVKERNLPSGSLSFCSDDSESSVETARSGCFWCSPKKVSRKKSVRRDTVVELGFDWEKNDEVLGDLKLFSSKEQKKLMKKAMKEEEKINREAEKIVKWAKKESARFDFSVVGDELSDDDDDDNGHNSRHH